MGLIKSAIGSALGADQPNNGFNGPRLPFSSQRPKSRSRDPIDDPYAARQRYPDYGYQDDSRFYSDDKVRISHQANDYASDYGHRDTRSNNPYYNSPDPRNNGYTLRNDSEDYYPDPYGPPPSYDAPPRRNLSPHSPMSYQRQPSSSSYRPRSRSRTPDFRPVALPQITYGDGQPFMRGYSVELERYGITEEQFIRVIDQINIAVIPNPENQIFQKAASIAGWFVPGAAGIGLMAGQIGVGITAAFGHASLVARNLSKANLDVFLPKGLEICIAKTKDIDNEVGIDSGAMQQDVMASPMSRVACYGDLLARLDYTYAPAQNTGRTDPLAKLGNALSSKANDKKMRKAQRGGKRQAKRVNELEESVKWLMVRRASPAALEHWRKTLDQSNAALEQEEIEARRR